MGSFSSKYSSAIQLSQYFTSPFSPEEQYLQLSLQRTKKEVEFGNENEDIEINKKIEEVNCPGLDDLYYIEVVSDWM